jgi:hypothetical protein
MASPEDLAKEEEVKKMLVLVIMLLQDQRRSDAMLNSSILTLLYFSLQLRLVRAAAKTEKQSRRNARRLEKK